MSLLWIDASRGAAGDMLLGALWDAGASARTMQAAVRAVVPAGLELRHEVRDGFRVARATVLPEAGDLASDPRRSWADIRRALSEAPLAPRVREASVAAFRALAAAEAAIHGTTAEAVHFHEVGGHDAIADVVGTAAALVDLGVDRVVSSPVAVGYPGEGGTATAAPPSAHGPLPVPVPAVLRLAADAGAPILSGALPGETCTPTGMALLATLSDAWGPLPPLRVGALGAGAGSRRTPGGFGALRVVLGAAASTLAQPETDVALVTETNVDDLDPRVWPRVLAQLLDAGADDAWLTPVLMKKGRPGHVLATLSSLEAAESVQDVVLRETTAIGLRSRPVAKRALPRDVVEVVVAGHDVRVKRAWLHGRTVNAQPEWEDVAAAAAATGLTAKEVLARASAQALAATDRDEEDR